MKQNIVCSFLTSGLVTIFLASPMAKAQEAPQSNGLEWLRSEVQRSSRSRELVHLDQYDAFKRCIDKNPVAMRRLVARVLGYKQSVITMPDGRRRRVWDRDPNLNDTINLTSMPVGAVYLPTIEQLRERYQANQRDQVNLDEFGIYWYWSSTIDPSINEAYYLNGHTGGVRPNLRDDHFEFIAVRCVRSSH